MRGRKPKPRAAQLAAGDPRKIGRLKLEQSLTSEVQATRGLPGCPRHLTGVAREAWKFWGDELKAMDIDRRPDAMMLEGACVSYSRAVEADKVVGRDGITVEESTIDEESGEKTVLRIKVHPAVTVSNRAWTLVRAFCSEFGLSPVSRMRLPSTNREKPGDDLMELLSGPREKRQVPVVQ